MSEAGWTSRFEIDGLAETQTSVNRRLGRLNRLGALEEGDREWLLALAVEIGDRASARGASLRHEAHGRGKKSWSVEWPDATKTRLTTRHVNSWCQSERALGGRARDETLGRTRALSQGGRAYAVLVTHLVQLQDDLEQLRASRVPMTEESALVVKKTITTIADMRWVLEPEVHD